jgi:hypothetical protein
MTPTPTTDSAVSPVRELIRKVREEIERSADILRPAELAMSVEAVIELHEQQSALSRRSLDTADGVEQVAYEHAAEDLAKLYGDEIAERCKAPKDMYSLVRLIVQQAIEHDRRASRTPNTEMVVKAEPKGWFDYRGTVERVSAILTEFGMPPEGEVDQFEWLRERLASPPSPAESDMALVPRIETDAMCEAGLEALRENLGHSAVIMRDAAACYRAMVTASLQLNKKG